MDTTLLRKILPREEQVLESFAENDWSFYGRRPQAIVFPHCEEEVASVLSLANDNGWNCMPVGNGTWLEACMNDCGNIDLLISMRKMNNIIVHEPDNLFVELEAGVTLKKLQATLRDSKQWLPLDPPGADSSTMGAIVATSSCGALQTGFGKPRDHILGATIITADGKTLNLGGKTVKNVAGFDLLKLLPGSWGQFGIITKLIMRLHPLPEADRTLLFSSKNQHEVTTMAHKIMHTPVTLQSISIVSEGIGQNVEPTDTIIAVRILESQEAVDQVEILIHESLGSHPCERLSGSRSEAFFERLKNAHMDSDIVIRIKSLPSMLKNLIEQLANLQTLMEDSGKSLMEFIAHYESGTLLVFIDKASEEEAWLDKSAATLIDFRKQVEEKGGSLTLLIAPEMIMNQVTPWGPLKEVETIFRGLEQVFDPNQILSPYRKSGE